MNHEIPLRVLVLNGCSSLSDELVSRFSRILYNLQELDLSSCLHVTDIGLSTITSYLINLQLLRLSWCINITDNGLIGIHEKKSSHEVKTEDTKKMSNIRQVSKLYASCIQFCLKHARLQRKNGD